jgi:hypothetical protein
MTQAISSSLAKVHSRLSLALQHLDIVDSALTTIRNSENQALVNHATTRNCELTLQMLYTHLNFYLKAILSEMFYKKPLQIVDKGQERLQFQEIIRLGTYEAICDHMIDRVFRRLQNERSTRNLIGKILDGTGVAIDDDVLENAMWYIDIRHLIVHNSGVVDQKFEKTYSGKYNYVKIGGKLPINVGIARRGVNAVCTLCESIDRELTSKGYI